MLYWHVNGGIIYFKMLIALFINKIIWYLMTFSKVWGFFVFSFSFLIWNISAFSNLWLYSCLFWFASRNLLLPFNCLITRLSSQWCSQCLFWSSLSDWVFITAALHFCAASWMSSESLGLTDLWRNIVWPTGIGHLQGTVRINEGKKVL